MATWARVLGRRLAGDEGIKQAPEQEYKELIGGDEFRREHMLQVCQMLRDFGCDGGGKDTVYPEDVEAEGLVASFEDYVKQEEWSDLLAG